MIVGVGFFLAATIAVLQTRSDGGFVLIWPASPILVAYLVTTARRHWPLGLLACAVANVVATGLYGLGWPAAPGLLLANMIEAVTAALILRHEGLGSRPVESLRQLGTFLLATVGIGMLASSLIAALTLTQTVGGSFADAFVGWYFGHALGMICFAPIFIFTARGTLRARLAAATVHELAELALLATLVAVIAVVVFAQSSSPLLFLPALPIMLATFRQGRLGALISIVVLTLVAASFTLRGLGPIGAMHDVIGAQLRFLQFYLATTVLTVMPVAAELARRNRLLRDLRYSEARYRILAEHSTDIILNADIDGNIRFVSPAVRGMTGFLPDELIGTPAHLLVSDDNRDALAQAHARAMQASGEGVRLQYLGRTSDGGARWFETHMQAVLDDQGRIDGTVAVIRDIGDHKARETVLSDEARRDPLTGLQNRRGFMTALEGVVAAGATGCLALFDLDHFKRINDSYGHPVGDAVLRHFGGVVGAMLRDGDCLSRIGGEEFAVLLRETDLQDAAAICDRIRRAVAASPLIHDGRPVRITVSGGVTPLRSASTADLMVQADAALYRAKKAGRDRMKIAA